MAIHYENYKAFSKGQGFVGSACRPISPQATTLRWFASDCPACKATLVGKRIVSRNGDVGVIDEVSSYCAIIKRRRQSDLLIPFRQLDEDWALLNLDEIFGMTS